MISLRYYYPLLLRYYFQNKLFFRFKLNPKGKVRRNENQLLLLKTKIMKKTISYLSLVAFLSLGLFFTSCKKGDVSNTDTTTETELKTQSDDQERFTNETDAVADDANAALENTPVKATDSKTNLNLSNVSLVINKVGSTKTETGVVIFSQSG